MSLLESNEKLKSTLHRRRCSQGVTSSETEKAVLKQRIHLLQNELSELQELRSQDMVQKIKDHACGDLKVNPGVYLDQIEKLEKDNHVLKSELDGLNLKHQKELHEIVAKHRNSEYSLCEENSK